MAKNLGHQTKQGLLWLSIYNSVEFIIRFGSQIVLARILFPEDFGLMGIIMLVTQFARNTASFGFNQALVQLKHIKKEHYNTVFVFNSGLMTVVTAVLFFSATYIADFFNDHRLAPMIKVISFDFVLRALFLTQVSKLNRKMKFRESLFVGTMRSIVNLVSPIIFAVLGYGVWSLVWGYMLGTVALVIGYFYFCPQFPRLEFHMWALKDIMSFSFWNFINKNVVYLMDNVDRLVIAKWLDVTQLGYYERAYNLRRIPSRQITRKINTVMFPAYSRMQDNTAQTVSALRKVIKYVSFLSYPLMVWMFFVSPSFVTVAYGAKWQPLIVPLQIMCISGIIIPLSQIFNPVLLAKGWVSQRVVIQTIYLVILVSTIAYSIEWGIIGVAWATTISSATLLLMTASYVKRRLSVSTMELFSAQSSPLVYGLVQITLLIILETVTAPFFTKYSWKMLILVSVVSFIGYVGAHVVFRFKDIDDIHHEFMEEAKKFVQKLPLINRLGSFTT